jgi:hypothetical protein
MPPHSACRPRPNLLPQSLLTFSPCARSLLQLKTHFRPEFLNRIDEMVHFEPLQLHHMRGIVRNETARVAERLAGRKMRLHLTDAAVDWLAAKGCAPALRLACCHFRVCSCGYLWAVTGRAGSRRVSSSSGSSSMAAWQRQRR